jgi:hypothetical protein
MYERNHGESGDVLISWLVKLVIGFALVGVLIFDVGTLTVNFFQLDSTAEDIAQQLASDVTDHTVDANRPGELEQRGKELALKAKARLRKVSIDDQGVLHIRLTREAATLVLSHIGALDKYNKATADSTASTS